MKIEPKAIGVGQYQHDVNQRDLARSLVETVRSHGVEPEALELEITETALIKDPEASQA